MLRKIIRHFQNDTLYRNSIYIMTSTTILAVFGFVFWMIIARLYNPSYVGIATTLISVMTLLAGISILGFNISLIRFLPKYEDRNGMINSSIVVVAISSIITSVIFLAGVNFFSPKLAFITTNNWYILIFLLSVLTSSWNLIIEAVFIAYRAAENIVFKNAALSALKLVFPFLFISLAAYGIFTSVVVAMTIAIILGFAILIYKYKFTPKLTINTKSLSHMAHFSTINYFSGLLYQAPMLLLPLIIIDFLNARFAAYYYIDAMILNFLIIIPIAVTQSFLAEGSYNTDELSKHFIKSTKFIAMLLLPAVIIFILFGNYILRFFGPGYETGAFTLLRLLSLSSIFIAIQLLGASALRIKHKNLILLICNGIGCVLTLLLCFVFIPYGINGIGAGWLIGQALTGLIFIFILKKEVY